MSKCKKIGIIVVILIPLTVIIVFPFIYKHAAHVYDPGHTYPITKTLYIIDQLQFTLDLMLTIEGDKHPIDMEMIKEYARTKNIHPVKKMIDNNEICDAWNNPILLFYEEPLTYTFISYGPNGKDDQGKGDDIVEIVEMNE